MVKNRIYNYEKYLRDQKRQLEIRINDIEEKIEEKKELLKSKNKNTEVREPLVLKNLKKKLEEVNSKIESLIPQDVLIRLSNVSMHFGGLKAVDNLSFDVKQGEIFGLIGPNGAGKTTVFNCITQFYKSTAGEIFYRNADDNVVYLNDVKVHKVINLGIIRTFQNVELVWELSVLDNIRVAGHHLYKSSLFDHFLQTKTYKKEEKEITEKALKVLDIMGLLPYKDFYPKGLPYGILKKIELARTLMCNPKLIILDEPAAGLNDKETEDLAKLIVEIKNKFNCTIFLVEHDMGLVMDICDTVCAISFGKKLALGTPEEIQNNASVQEAYLGGE